MAKQEKNENESHPWRDNIEAISGAIVVALLFKYFVLEISKIPSGSMQPTLMGHVGTGVFDRVLVDKLSFHLRDPERYEIVVFKHPLERSRVMVKRLVGMPGEDLKIDNGDLWTRSGEGDEWTILRPPPQVQDEYWRRLDLDEPAQPSWSSADGSAWLPKGRNARTNAPGRLAFRPRSNGIRNEYTDGYPDSLRRHIAGDRGTAFVGDVRVQGEVEPTAAVTAFVVELTEGERRYEFRFPGPASDAAATAEIRCFEKTVGSSPGDRTERAESGRLAKAKGYSFAAQNLNDRLTLELNGDTVLEFDIPAATNQRAQIHLAFEGGGGEFEDLHVLRDIYYVSPEPAWVVSIPEGNYVMCGDNTRDSADSRLWEEQSITLADLGERRGNYRLLENPVAGGASGDLIRFKDSWGEVDWFRRDAVQSLNLSDGRALAELGAVERRPLVPRHLILGRALAIFWPIQPTRGLWRLGWLH